MDKETAQNQQENKDKPHVETMLEEMGSIVSYLLKKQKEICESVDNKTYDAEESIQLTPCINNTTKIINQCNTFMRRYNIETQGYDSSVHIAALKLKKQQQAEQTDQPDDQKPQELNHLNSVIKEYQKALPPPKDEENVEGVETDDNADKKEKKVQTKPAPSIITPSKTRPPIITYNPNGFQPYGQMRDLFKSHEPIKIASGTYDAGKTYSCVAYMDMLARQYPGARLTFIHRYLNRVYRNVIPTYEKYLGFKPSTYKSQNPTPIIKYGGELPEFFEYWNGSRIYINGLDKIENMLSDFYDGAFVNQAELVEFDSWDHLRARVSERAGTAPIAFLLGDCNPSTPNHWIRRQTQVGKLKFFEMTFRDNPEIYNQQTGEITEEGKRRVDRLQDLEGLRYKRGYEGLWVSGEGLVFEEFQPDIHIVDNFDIPKEWPRYLSIDWGYRNPSSCIWWTLTKDERIYAYKEIYKTKLTQPEFIKMIEDNQDEDRHVAYAAVDSADQDAVEQLKNAGYRVQEPKKSRAKQIDVVKERLKVDETGKPSIFFFRNRLVHPPDQELKEAYRPTEVTDEFLTCEYLENTDGTDKDDEAITRDHHGIDSTAYFILSLQRPRTVGSGKFIGGAVTMGKSF
ncbi:MAG: hypothetical protein OXD54_05190 [Candidatus Poribacteria bacterium]|nr:hypothetical protein [Candidatus Poribacteria bacterium]